MKTPIDWLVDECMFQDTDYFGKEIAWANAAFRNAIRYAYEQGYVDAAINLGETQPSTPNIDSEIYYNEIYGK